MNLKRVTVLLFAALFVLLAAFPTYAAESGLSASDATTSGAAPPAARRTIRLSMPEDESLEIERIFNAVLTDLGYNVEPTHNLRRTAVSETNMGDTDIVGLLPEGIQSVYTNLIRVPFAVSSVTFISYTRDTNTSTYTGWESLAGKTIGYMPHNLYVPLKTPTSSTLVTYKSETLLWEGLNNSEVDVIVLPEFETVPRYTPRGFRIAGTVEYAPSYAYVHKSNISMVGLLLSKFNEYEESGQLAEMKQGIQQTPNKRRRVLHITSYNLDALWEEQLTQGLHKGLALKENETIETFQLNTRHIQDWYTQRRNTALAIRNTFLSDAPDVIVTSDNEALEFLKEYYHTLFTNIPVVFCGVNNYHEDMINNLRDLAVGCTESISGISTVREMLSLYPNTQRVFIVNDYVSSGLNWRADIENQMERYNPAVEIVYSGNVTHEQNLAQVEAYGPETLVLLGSYFTDSANEFWAESETQARFAEVSESPVFTLVSSFVGSGAVGGMVCSAYNQGEYAGQTTRKILDGTSVGSLSVYLSTETINEWYFDLDVLSLFGLTTKDMPDDARYVNRSLPLWETAPQQFAIFMVIFGTMALAILIFLILLHKANGKVKHLRGKIVDIIENPLETSMYHALEWLADVLRGTPVIFMAELDGKIAVVNDYAREHLKVEPGDGITRVFKSGEIHNETLRKLRTTDVISKETIPLLLANGETHRHLTTFAAFSHEGERGYLLLASNVEKEEQSQDYISRTNSEMQKITETLPMAMAIINSATDALEYANIQFLGLINCKTIYQAKRAEMAQIKRQIFARWQGSTVQFEYVNDHIRTNHLTIRLHANQIIFNGQNCFVIVGQDISAEARHADLLARAAEKEREANQLKSLFLANMSHEIRTPMNAILGLSQTALMKEQTPENAGTYKKIGSAAKTLLSIINDILDFSKIEAEKLVIVEEEFMLEETIGNVFLVATEHAEDKPIEILLDAAPDVPAILCGDKSRLWQILKNLLDNSVKYTNAGRVILSIAAKNMAEDDVRLRFTITDTGVGMTEEQLAKLFAPFEQFHRNVTKAAGTGLGMSITKNLIQLLNGTIAVKSEVNTGTVFEVELPFKLPPMSPSIINNALGVTKAQPDVSRPVLIADDDPEARRIMAGILKEIGLETVCASSLEETARDDYSYQFAIVDYKLGGTMEHGKRAVQVISEYYTGIKIFLSAPTKWNALSEGSIVRDIIEKPFTVTDFLSKIFGDLGGGADMVAAPEQSLFFPNARVLLVEDNEINQLVVNSILENFGVVPEVANNGLEALEILEQKEFDVVFMDISMPVMDGHTATAKIRGGGKPYKNVPIVAMTANVMPEEVARYMAEGMNGFLEKPIDLEAFQASLVEFLG